ncbi:MAG: heavy metal-responsive transcriptional regulator [Actinomycetota bacterium]|nr:heavy metal-responsive transcriptional regulator [Actinomycetota bacterium]
MTDALVRESFRTVSELARMVGCTPDTIRFYKREGLLQPVRRTPAGYRQYDDTSVDRMLFIQGAQRLGLSLRDIRELLVVRDTGECPCEPAQHLLTRRLAEVDAEMVRLGTLRAQMAAMLARLPDDCPPPAPGTWCEPTAREGGEPR